MPVRDAQTFRLGLTLGVFEGTAAYIFSTQASRQQISIWSLEEMDSSEGLSDQP